MHTATMQSYCEGGDAIVCVGRPIMWRKPRMPLKESQLQLGLWDLSLPPPLSPSSPLLPLSLPSQFLLRTEQRRGVVSRKTAFGKLCTITYHLNELHDLIQIVHEGLTVWKKS